MKARRSVEASEARFRRIFESDTIAFVFSKIDGRVTDANDYFLRVLGVSREDLRAGRINWEERTPPGYEEVHRNAARALRTTGVCPPFEKEYIRSDGQRIPVVVGISLLPGSDEDVVTFVLDISERKRIENQIVFLSEASRLIASSDDYLATLASLTRLSTGVLGDWCAVYLKDEDGAIRLVASHHTVEERHAIGRQLVSRFAFDPEADVGPGYVLRTGRTSLIPEVTPHVRAQLSLSAEQRELIERFGIRSSLLVALSSQGRNIGLLSFGISESSRTFDAGDQRLAEELGTRVALTIERARLYEDRMELLEREQQARAEAETANRAKDEFLAMLGHELRNPLAPIITALQLMQLRGVDAVERERVVIERQAKHLVHLVDDLLDVSRITRGKIELKMQAIEIADVVARAIEMASPLLEHRKHELETHVAPRGLGVHVDPARMAQVISNLLTNAAKYTADGGTISIVAEHHDDQVEVRVRDSGIGIEPEMLPHVFEMFVQERQALDRSHGGLGLGLAIVRSLVRMHGGTVHARSEGRGRGSEFTVRLPAVEVGAAMAIPNVLAQISAPGINGRRILVVDDNEDAAELLAEHLQALGNTTRVAHDGPAALRIASEFMPDLALLDIGLPVMDGYELARRMRDVPGVGRLHLIAVTGYGQEKDRHKATEAGFDAHLVKPVSTDRLKALISDLAGDVPAR